MFGCAALEENLSHLETVNCVEVHGEELYFESAPSKIVRSPLGAYREMSEGHYNRMAYKFFVVRPGKAHLAVINYPDDKMRTMCVMDGLSYDMSTGIGTGLDLPLTNKMQKHNLVFWPRSKECSLMFINYGDKGGPCAVSSIEIYEIKSGSLISGGKNAQIDRSHRTIGMQWEDPCGKLKSMGASSIGEWAERLAEYAIFAGQNIIEYPISWYYGPLYPSSIEKPDFPHFTITEDGTLLSLIVEKPSDWVGEAMDILERENIFFKPVVHLLRLNSLMDIGAEQMKKGPDVLREDFILNIRADGKIQTAVSDWTKVWKTSNIENWNKFPTHTGHEPWNTPELPPGPMYNPLHPTVQDALEKLFAEIGNRYGCRKNFAGISIPLWGTTFLWFSSMESGYDDFTFALLEKETGLKSGINGLSSDRFAARAGWITDKCSEKWICWRCEKIKKLLVKLARLIPCGLTISVCPEPLLGHLKSPSNSFQNLLYNNESLYDICRTGGIDFDLYDGTDGVNLELQMTHSRYRHNFANASPYPNLYWDYNFLDKKTFDRLRCRKASAYIFNCYYESGQYDFKRLPPDDFKDFDAGTGKIKSVCEMTLRSKHPIWTWHKHEFTTGNGIPPSGRNFLEHYAHALAEFDAQSITQGGLTPGLWGHEEELREFSDVFKSLPAENFDTMGERNDPVVLRVLKKNKHIWFYLVNREQFSIKTILQFDKKSGVLLSVPSKNKTIFEDGSLEIVLKPFELTAFITTEENTAPCSLSVFIPEDEQKKLHEENARLLQIFNIMKNDPLRVENSFLDKSLDMEKKYCEILVENIEFASGNKMFSYQRRLLTSLKWIIDKTDIQTCLRNQERLISALVKNGRAGINCGSSKEIMSESGTLWLPDQLYIGNGSYGHTGAMSADRGNIKICAETDKAIYRTEAWGNHVAYRVPLPPGKYNLRLHFAETYNHGPGKRLFSVCVNGQMYPRKIDPFAESGGFAKPFILEFENLPADKAVDVELEGGVEINAIEIYKV